MRLATSFAMCSWSSTTIVRMRSWEWPCDGGTREGPRPKWSRASTAAPASACTPEAGECIRRGFALRGERAAAAAAAGRVRVLEGEARALHRRDVVDRHAVDVLGGEGIDEDSPLPLVDHEVVLGGLVLDQKPVLEATAPARLDADAEPALGGVDAFLRHELHDLGAGHGRHGQHDIGLLGRAHL